MIGTHSVWKINIYSATDPNFALHNTRKERTIHTTLDPQRLSEFLVRAKIVTYASGSDAFTVAPVLANSHQLEFTEGGLLYRDIYYGGLHFIGMETVFQAGKPIWGMSYYGGVLPGSSENQLAGMPPFLKAALREVPLAAPYRGPASFQQGEYSYENEIHGNLLSFHGTEIIRINAQDIYKLHYSGGQIE
jgi:hypothetical protein